MEYRDEVYFQSEPEKEIPFPAEEFRDRLTRIRRHMAKAGIDMLYLMAPESMYYVSGYQTEWYQAQSPKQWPASSAIAVHVDHDKFILFDTWSSRFTNIGASESGAPFKRPKPRSM